MCDLTYHREHILPAAGCSCLVSMQTPSQYLAWASRSWWLGTAQGQCWWWVVRVRRASSWQECGHEFYSQGGSSVATGFTARELLLLGRSGTESTVTLWAAQELELQV